MTPAQIRSAVRSLIEMVGPKRAALQLGLHPASMNRVASGAPVQPATLAVCEARMDPNRAETLSPHEQPFDAGTWG
jgi:hypothetical protein